MWNQHGKNIMDFLAERCEDLGQQQFELSHQIFKAIPTLAELPEFIERLSTVREQLPRCEALRKELATAVANDEPLDDIVRNTEAECSDEMEPLCGDGTEMTSAQSFALEALRSLTRELAGFSTVGQGSPSRPTNNFPNPLDALVDSRRAEAA